MIATAEPSLKRCLGCGRTLPMSVFPVRSDRPGRRRAKCRECWARYMAAYRYWRRQKLLHDFCRRTANAKTNRQAIRLADRYAKRFGARRLAYSLVDYTLAVASRRPGNAAVLTAIKAIYRISFAPPAG
jgi:hypothetical protein